VDKTNVDDMLIEMISPRIREIEEKFSRGEGLDQEDINTLLLKSQYNHINHLDSKLNEVTADVASLKGEFIGLKGEFSGLKGGFKLLEISLNARFDTFEKNIELKMSQAINTNMRWSIGMIALVVTVLKIADMFVK
jgi:predicted nuclease with TOPRIM domain